MPQKSGIWLKKAYSILISSEFNISAGSIITYLLCVMVIVIFAIIVQHSIPLFNVPIKSNLGNELLGISSVTVYFDDVGWIIYCLEYTDKILNS